MNKFDLPSPPIFHILGVGIAGHFSLLFAFISKVEYLISYPFLLSFVVVAPNALLFFTMFRGEEKEYIALHTIENFEAIKKQSPTGLNKDLFIFSIRNILIILIVSISYIAAHLVPDFIRIALMVLSFSITWYCSYIGLRGYFRYKLISTSLVHSLKEGRND